MSSWKDIVAKAIDRFLDRVGTGLAIQLAERPVAEMPNLGAGSEQLRSVLRPGDVLLVEGHAKIATAIKYLTQSTWSHAALFVGDSLDRVNARGEPLVLVEANVGEGVVASPLSKYAGESVRICRPMGLAETDCRRIVSFVTERIGNKYDMRNIVDLARYLLPTPPVPVRWRRRMLALGSGDPTRAICSTLIAQAFESVGYPVLPHVERHIRQDCDSCPITETEILHIRHHSLFVPRDFDLSPYFEIVKPSLEAGFSYRNLIWASPTQDEANAHGERDVA